MLCHYVTDMCGVCLGYRGVSFDAAPLNETEAANPEVRDGGHWQPSNCIARTRVAVIIPFRNRSHHLEILLKHLHPILKSQMINYTIVVVEQASYMVSNITHQSVPTWLRKLKR